VFLLKAATENRVAHANRSTDIIRPQEGVVPIVEIARSPAQNVCIQRDDQRRETRCFSAVEHRDGDFFFFVFGPVQLKPTHAVAVGFGCFFDVRAGCCAHYIGNVVLRAGAGDG
jgi:hypothetical protein